MRSLATALLSEQSKLNRKPGASLVLRDVMLRLDQDWQTSLSTTGYPSLLDASDVPQCPLDMAINTHYGAASGWPSQAIKRTWSSSSLVYDQDVHTLATWGSSINQYVTDAMHRPAAYDRYIYYAYYDELGETRNIRRASYGSSSVFHADAYTCDTDHLALTAVSDGVLYMAILHEEDTFKYISLHRVTGTAVTDCPYHVIVDSDYSISSLQWFDAETLGSKDVIIVNTRTYGQPMVITRSSDGVWSTPRHIMRIDELNSNSFLRISHLTSIADSTGDDVLWATGRLSRPGSSGAHPQSFDVALKSKDGEHWTFDRHAYLCSTEMRSKLMPIGSYVYYASGATVMRGKRTWLMNNDHSDLKLEIEDDILSWSLTQAREGAAMSGGATLAAGDGTYNRDTEDSDYLGRWTTSDGNLAVYPGMWLWRKAGYNGENDTISVEGIDTTPGSYQVARRAFSFQSRDIVMRSLYDWSADQTYELLSQVMHHDPCTKLNKLYSISAGQIEVEKDEDKEITGEVDEDELDDASGQLVFDTPNKPAINLCTKPTEARDFQVKVRFRLSDESGVSTIDSGYKGATLDVASGSGGLSYNTSGANYYVGGVDLSDYCTQGTEDPRYIIVITNSDGTISWAFIGTERTASSEYYVRQNADGDPGWAGADTDDKTPSSYVVARSDSWLRLGTGVGAIGCVTDQYNLIAAIPDLTNEKLYLVIRRGDADSSTWIPWKIESMTSSPIKSNELYETVMVRRGSQIEAQVLRHPYNAGSYGSRESVTAKITAEWPLNEPMVSVSDESYDQTDRGKIGVVCTISVPETELGACRADKDFLIRNPDLFERDVSVTYVVSGETRSGTIHEDIYTDIDDFIDMMEWDDATKTFVETSGMSLGDVPPFHFGGEKYDPSNWNWDPGTGAEFGEDGLGRTAIDEYSPSEEKWLVVWKTHHNYAEHYSSKADSSHFGGQIPYDGRYFTAQAGGDNPQSDIMYHYYTVYGDDGTAGYQWCYPMIMRGDDDAVSARGLTNLITRKPTHEDWRGDKLFIDDCSLDEFGERTWKDGEFPTITVYPGFYLPGRASKNNPAESHGKGTKIRQHWSPTLTIEGVWATDGESDKNLEWTMKDIATRAGVLDFDTEYSINTSGSLPVSPANPTWLDGVLGDDVQQRDCDLTIELGSAVGSDQGVEIYARMSSEGDPDSPSSLVGIRLVYYNDASSGPYVKAYQTNSSTGWVLVDSHYLDSSVAGSTIRLVARERFFTFYVDGHQCPSLTIGPAYGYDSDGWSSDLDSAGYLGVRCLGSAISATITQPELWAWTDAVVVDTRQNAIGGLERALRERRIKFVPTIGSSDEPVLRISYMALPYTTSNITTFDHWLGTITDHQSGDADYPAGGTHVSIYRDETGETDRIPSHIRVIGSEVSEYVDHNSARRYGLLFMSQQCPHLEEEEAYQEAARIVRDAISHSGARRPTTAAQLHWESEDALLLDYTTYDGQEVSGYFIVDSVTLNYTAEPSLEASASLRKLSWGS